MGKGEKAEGEVRAEERGDGGWRRRGAENGGGVFVCGMNVCSSLYVCVCVCGCLKL